jgi:membrane-bound lytic murein transglycosylase D
MKKALLTISILFTTINCFTQTIQDTIIAPFSYVENTDSMQLQIDTAMLVQNLFVPLYVPDSVYIKRLSALPFEFKMTYNPVVKRYIELYTVKIKDKLQVIIGLSDFYFPIIDEIFSAYHLPKELRYVSIIESALNPQAVSRTHAVGLWQFMKGTGKENGLTINNYVDARRGIVESTKAAARYLTFLYSIYHDWQLVLAAYNCGPGNVNKAIHRSGGKRDFWEIYKHLPRETRGYVPSFIGAAYALNYYQNHNIYPIPTMLPLASDTLLICKNLHLGQVSEVLGVPIDFLRKLNPQYLKDIIPANSKNINSLRIPCEQKSKFVELRDSIYAYRSSFYQTAVLNYQAYSPSTDIDIHGKVIHRVRSGESISLIAAKYRVSVKRIKEWNNISGDKIRQGQRLIVYSRRAAQKDL